MNNKKLIPLLLTSFFAASSAHAAVDLIAIGTVDGNYQDLSARTAGLLENGVPGNILGGVGSGLAYAGGNTFIAVPDRGPNANPYNPLIDDTTSYINRFHSFNLSLAANPNYVAYDALAPIPVVGSMPYILSPALTATTLMSSPSLLAYAATGIPALNKVGYNYFTGRSDNFVAKPTDPKKPVKTSTYDRHGRLDPEGVRVSNDGKSVFISDEYGPFVYQFNRSTGRRMKAFALPSKFAVTNLRAFETGLDGEIEVNKIANGGNGGRTTNKGMEGLAITPDGLTLVGVMQASLIQDTSKYIRIVAIEIATGITKEYAYKLVSGSGISEIVAINNTEFLVLERDGKGLGDGTTAVHKKLYKIDITGATDVSSLATIGATTPLVNATPNLFLDMVAKLTAPAIGISATNIPAKIESVAFGPDMVIGGVTKHTLFLANDNDFLATVSGIDNPNKFFVFTFEDADLPTLTPQVISPLARDLHDRG